MAPTSEQRREVAERLRTEVSEDECIDYAVFRIINDALQINGAWGAKAARILADLIDPTCHVVIPNEIEGDCFCSECGALVGEYGYTAYCPNCGCRLVGGYGK